MANNIVNINVTRDLAPSITDLQKMGAILSFGSTNLTAGTSSFLTQLSDLTSLINGAITISSLTWATNVVTVTTSAPHGIPSGDVVEATIAGAVPAAYNVTNVAMTSTGASTLTYALVTSPGAATTKGTWTLEDISELNQQVTTFFAQGNQQGVYVLEMGVPSSNVNQVALLTTWLTANPLTFYHLLLPRVWGSDNATLTAFLALAASYNNTEACQYFHLTLSLANDGLVNNTYKCIIATVEAPTTLANEFSAAALFYVVLHYNPSSTNMVTPLAFAFVYGVTAYPTMGNGPLFNTLKTNHVNIIGTGQQGGLPSQTILFWGTTMDGEDFTYWYSVDWVQLNLKIDLTNEVINGSNNPQAPLYFNQPGINRLQARGQATMNRGITYGLVLGPVTVNAVDFVDYVAQNPNDYPARTYNGLGVTYSPQRGFESITMNVDVTDFPLP